MAEYAITEPPQSAEPLLYNSYLHSLWDGLNERPKRGMQRVRSASIAGLTKNEFYEAYHRRFEKLLAHPNRLLLAVTSTTQGEEDWVGAWLLGDTDEDLLRVHWLFVKSPYRRRGFASALFDAALRRVGDPSQVVATHEIPRWSAKIREMGIRREPLGRVG
jgi:GNAT superfamily N-acetyltransferase